MKPLSRGNDMDTTRRAHNRNTSRLRRIAGGALAALLLAAAPAYAAITAGDVLDKMNRDEQHGYITGAIDMAAYLAYSVEKNPKKSECITNWYYGKGAPGPRDVVRNFERYRDKPAIGVLRVLMDTVCGGS